MVVLDSIRPKNSIPEAAFSVVLDSIRPKNSIPTGANHSCNKKRTAVDSGRAATSQVSKQVQVLSDQLSRTEALELACQRLHKKDLVSSSK